MRRLVGTLAGLITALFVVFAIEALESAIYPPVTVDPSDLDAMSRLVLGLPFGAKLIVALGWAIGPLVGTIVSLRIDHWDRSAWIITLVFIAVGLFSVIMIPHPAWMQVASVVSPVIGGTIGLGLSRWLLARRYARGRVHGADRATGG